MEDDERYPRWIVKLAWLLFVIAIVAVFLVGLKGRASTRELQPCADVSMHGVTLPSGERYWLIDEENAAALMHRMNALAAGECRAKPIALPPKRRAKRPIEGRMTLDDLKEIVPTAHEDIAAALIAQMPLWGVKGMQREAAFLAHCAHETDGLTKFDESLYYTNAERVRLLFRRHFDALDVDDAWGYLAQPERFANRVYANRMGNGPESSGDGWRYRGRGGPMLTGKDAYTACAHGIGRPLVENPELLLKPEEGAMAACWFFKWKGLGALADAGDFEATTRKWNGGLIGFEDRERYYSKALEVLA